MSKINDMKDNKLDVGELDSKTKKILKKFDKRKRLEMEKNQSSGDFKFAAADEQYWYFEFEVQAGLYVGQKHIIEVKLIFGRSPDIYIYPMSAPKCTFITPIWHPNISDKGTICLDVLKDNWSPSMFTATILSALKLLLEEPDSSSPQNPEAAKMMDDKETYKKYVETFYSYDKAPLEIRNMFKIPQVNK